MPKLETLLQFCQPLHGKHLQMLILQMKGFNRESLKLKQLKVFIDSLINQFYTYYNFNINQIPELGLSRFDKFIKDLCQIQDQENVLFLQLKQLIEQVKPIINKILKKMKNQSNLNQNNTQLSTTKLIQEQSQLLINQNIQI
ncbi:unnamed protein product [Paramecium octaurelia]|uniref:Uncharacterized protein n=1 Tax=Paramecium octaurelia TaxID=43137 RepID=A0A8S1YKV8_PAROT|nr:unnamed protein product [Paramecium octaurelia]